MYLLRKATTKPQGLKGAFIRMLTEVGGTPINLNPGECWLWSSTEVEGQKENKAWLYSMQSSTIQEAPKDQAHKFRPVISVYKTQ